MDTFAVGFLWHLQLTLPLYLVLFLAVSSACCSIGYCLHQLCKIYSKKSSNSSRTSDLESQTETTQLTKVSVTVDEGRKTKNVYAIGNPVYAVAPLSTDSESKLTRDNKEPSTTGQQIQQHTHATETHNNDPQNAESIVTVENPLCVQEYLQAESELESDNIGVKDSQQSSPSTTNKLNSQPGVDVAGQGSLVEKAVQIQMDIEPNRKQVSTGNTIDGGHLTGATKFTHGIASTDSEEQTTSSQFMINDLAETTATFSFKTDINNTTIENENTVHVAKANTSGRIVHISEIESDAIKERGSSLVYSELQYSHGDTNFSEAEAMNFATSVEPNKQQLDIMTTNGAVADVQGIESSCSQTQYSKFDDVELENVKSTHSRSEELTQSHEHEMCGSMPFLPEAESQSEMHISDDPPELKTRKQTGLQHLDKGNISELSQEIEARKEVEKLSNSKEEEDMADQKILKVEVKPFLDQSACFPTDSTKRELEAIMQISSSITYDAHSQAASTPPTELHQYVNVDANPDIESSCTLPSSNTGSNSQTARKRFSNSCDIHDYEEIPDFLPKPRVLQAHTEMEQPTSMDTDKDMLDDGVAHVLASLHSSFATPRGEDTDEIHPAKVKKHALKGKLYKLHRSKPSAQLKQLQNPPLASTSSEEEGIDLLQKSENSQPVSSTQETVSGEQPCVDRFTFKYKLRKPIHRTEDLISKWRQVTDDSDSQKVHSVCSAQVEMVTKRKQPSANISKPREGLQMHKILSPEDIQEPTLNDEKVASQSSKVHCSSSGTSRPADIVNNEIKSIHESKADLDICLNSKDKESSPHYSNVIAHNQRDSKVAPVKRKQVTIKRSKSEEKLPVNYKMCGHDSDQLRKFSPPHNLYLHGTLPTKMKSTKEELRRQYRHRPPPPKNSLASPLARNKEDIFVITSPSNESEDFRHDQSDTFNVVHDYEEIDLEEFPAKKREASAAASKLKSKEELRKLYRRRAPPKIPTVLTDCKEDILTDVQQTEASEQDPDHDEHSGLIAHKPQESTSELEGITPPEKEVCIQSSSASTEKIPDLDTVRDKSAEFLHVQGEEDQPMSNAPWALESTAEGNSSHLLPASDSEDNYMPLIPKRKKKKANSGYETLRFQQ